MVNTKKNRSIRFECSRRSLGGNGASHRCPRRGKLTNRCFGSWRARGPIYRPADQCSRAWRTECWFWRTETTTSQRLLPLPFWFDNQNFELISVWLQKKTIEVLTSAAACTSSPAAPSVFSFMTESSSSTSSALSSVGKKIINELTKKLWKIYTWTKIILTRANNGWDKDQTQGE